MLVPPPGRKPLLEELHEAHPGISRMKSTARTLMWWPNIDKDIEQKPKFCVQCQTSRPAPPSAPLHPWSWPDKPLHLDYTGPLENKMFLVVKMHIPNG